MSVWLRKVRTVLELFPLSTKPVCERAADHNRQPDERAGVQRVNRPRAFIKENLPTASNMPVVTGNLAAEHSLHADESSYTHTPAATSHSPGSNTVYPMLFLHPMWPFPHYRPTSWKILCLTFVYVLLYVNWCQDRFCVFFREFVVR